MKIDSDLLCNLDKIHITNLGNLRIKRNLGLDIADVVAWSKEQITLADKISRKGKNWYVCSEKCVITINAHSYTIITAHLNNRWLR